MHEKGQVSLVQKDITHQNVAAFLKAMPSIPQNKLVNSFLSRVSSNNVNVKKGYESKLEDIGITSHDLNGTFEDKLMLSSSYQLHEV